MYKPKMIENEKNLHCLMKHELPVTMVILDSKLTQNQRLLCQECIDNFESEQTQKTIGFKKIVQKIEDNKQQQLSILENLIISNIKQVESFQIEINNLKSMIIQQLDQIINNTKDWILNLKQIGFKYSEYSFFKELDLIIINQQNNQNDQINCQNQIKILNQSQITKINSKLEQFKSFQEYQQLKNILNKLNEQTQNIFIIQQQQKQQLSPNQLLFIDNTIEQKEICNAIVFDSTGKIMVSTCENKILIWNFNNGKIQKVQTLSEHQKDVICLIYSKIKNYFISGSNDGSIILWKQLNNNQWQSSKPQCEHKKQINCIILTQNENQLISGSLDSLINVWRIDFINNQLTFLYSLQKHTNSVTSQSLNESERVLVSCGDDKLIIIWQKDANNKWTFQQVVKQSIQDVGTHVKFIKEDQFILLPYKFNCLYVFQQKDGQFQEIIEKKVQFKKINYGYLNQSFFPIIFIKDKNLICLRHKDYIILLKEQNDGQLQIVQELDCQHWNIFGTVTNNGQYLIYWGENKMKYEIYEIQYK
ncbi:unnamed protein product [Paramecium pentaurelia]|uniref:WD40-repeat-containing domain n=1 Tax=Paramecium pentaurelia TaxID=43138 RepID=A0A8S1X3T4_9CILI|nr:unnamed protein product [Paramecium pentaurelia]CAD8192926.1 unnamed protein product [Paramecium pentaurelia]